MDKIVYITEKDKEWHQDVWVTDGCGSKINISCASGKDKSTPLALQSNPTTIQAAENINFRQNTQTYKHGKNSTVIYGNHAVELR